MFNRCTSVSERWKCHKIVLQVHKHLMLTVHYFNCHLHGCVCVCIRTHASWEHTWEHVQVWCERTIGNLHVLYLHVPTCVVLANIAFLAQWLLVLCTLVLWESCFHKVHSCCSYPLCFCGGETSFREVYKLEEVHVCMKGKVQFGFRQFSDQVGWCRIQDACTNNTREVATCT